MLPSHIHRYTIATFLKSFITLLVMLFALIVMFDSIELLRRAAKVDGLPFSQIIQLALFKLPDAGQEVFPFVILFSSILTYWTLNKRSELVIYRGAGLSAWQFTLPVAFTAFCIGVIFLFILNPLSTLMLGRYEVLESKHLGSPQNIVTLSKNGLWLKQDKPYTNIILHAGGFDINSWTLSDVTLLYLNKNDSFQKRVDAPIALLNDKEWLLHNAVINGASMQSMENKKNYAIETDLSRQDIIDSFADPKLVSFWSLPAYIDLMDESGISTRSTRMHYLNLLTQPFFFTFIALLAASFCLKPARLQNVSTLLGLTLLSAFGLFFLSNFLQALGASEQLPVFLSAWAPSFITLLLAVNIIMVNEDG